MVVVVAGRRRTRRRAIIGDHGRRAPLFETSDACIPVAVGGVCRTSVRVAEVHFVFQLEGFPVRHAEPNVDVWAGAYLRRRSPTPRGTCGDQGRTDASRAEVQSARTTPVATTRHRARTPRGATRSWRPPRYAPTHKRKTLAAEQSRVLRDTRGSVFHKESHQNYPMLPNIVLFSPPSATMSEQILGVAQDCELRQFCIIHPNICSTLHRPYSASFSLA